MIRAVSQNVDIISELLTLSSTQLYCGINMMIAVFFQEGSFVERNYLYLFLFVLSIASRLIHSLKTLIQNLIYIHTYMMFSHRLWVSSKYLI